MGAQDNTEKVLRSLHVLLSKSEPYPKEPSKVIIDKQQVIDLLAELNTCIYQIMDEYELTIRSRDKAERDFHKKGDQIIWDASRKAEDIYAASVMYMDETLNRMQDIMQEADKKVGAIYQEIKEQMEKEEQELRTNKSELKGQLQDLVDTEKYLKIIEERNREIEKEKMEGRPEYEQEKREEKAIYANRQTDIKINQEYLDKLGLSVIDETEKEVEADKGVSYADDDDEEEDEEEDDRIKVAVIGKPNVGKSSLLNKILGHERVIVSNVAGTTRDAIDSYFENSYGKYNFIDTAGMRKKSKVDDSIEKYSVLRATMAIERSDVCLILIDAQEGVTEQDTKIAGLAHEAGKACIIVVNKWDLVEKDGKTMDRMREDIRRDLSYMPYAPILFISAATGQRVNRLFELINYVNDQAAVRITTGMLNSVLADAQTRVQPPTDKGRRLKIYYMTQVGVKPPHFVIFCNDKKLFHFSYQRYLENQLRSVFGLEGTPIQITIRQKGEDDG